MPAGATGPEASKLAASLNLNGDVDVGDINLSEMNPEDIRVSAADCRLVTASTDACVTFTCNSPFITSAKDVMFSSTCVCLFVGSYTQKTSQPIFTKFGVKLARGHGRNRQILVAIRITLR